MDITSDKNRIIYYLFSCSKLVEVINICYIRTRLTNYLHGINLLSGWSLLLHVCHTATYCLQLEVNKTVYYMTACSLDFSQCYSLSTLYIQHTTPYTECLFCVTFKIVKIFL